MNIKAKNRWKASEIVGHINAIEKIVEENKKKNKLKHFTAITADEIENKFTRANSPMIVAQSWNSTNQGGAVNYNVTIYNPDPGQAIWLFAHVWVGSGNVEPALGTFLNNVDTRFPTLTQPDFSGLSLPSGDSATLSFSLSVPSSVEETNYIGNSCLMGFNWHDVGTYYDRGVFVFNVA